MAGEDLLEDNTGTESEPGKKPHKPLSKGQKIGVAIGLVTIALFIYEIEKNKSAAASAGSSASSPVNPDTGLDYTGGDGGGGGYDSGDSGIDPTTGASYASEMGTDPATGASYSSELSTLGTDYQNLTGQYSTLESQFATWSTTGTTTTNPIVKGPSAVQQSNLAKLNQELGKDEAAKKPNQKAISTLKKQISAVTKRS